MRLSLQGRVLKSTDAFITVAIADYNDYNGFRGVGMHHLPRQGRRGCL